MTFSPSSHFQISTRLPSPLMVRSSTGNSHNLCKRRSEASVCSRSRRFRLCDSCLNKSDRVFRRSTSTTWIDGRMLFIVHPRQHIANILVAIVVMDRRDDVFFFVVVIMQSEEFEVANDLR